MLMKKHSVALALVLVVSRLEGCNIYTAGGVIVKINCNGGVRISGKKAGEMRR